MQAYRGMETKQPGLAIVVALHVLVIWTLWTGLSRTAIERVRPPMDAVPVQDVKPPEPETRPLPPVKIVTVPQVVVPVQEVVIDTPPDAPRMCSVTSSADCSRPAQRWPRCRCAAPTRSMKASQRIRWSRPRWMPISGSG